jgi:8-oxo-dGTP pyrophosphatase MutT (NUDIX family)
MDYIRKIREHIGHDLVMTVGCGVLVEDDEGKLLLQKRSDTGEWCIPGGGMEPVETFEETAIRELREEVGIEVSELTLFGIYSGEKRIIHYPNEDVVYSLSIIFRTKKYSGNISDDDSEVLEHRFFRKDEVPVNLFPCDSRAILDWVEGTESIIVN